jgi:hypothetical protein
MMEVVYEFLYNSDCCESAARTMSIHRTKRGAEIAMEFHRFEKKREHEESLEGNDGVKYKEEFPYDYDQWWGIRETIIQD